MEILAYKGKRTLLTHEAKEVQKESDRHRVKRKLDRQTLSQWKVVGFNTNWTSDSISLLDRGSGNV